MTRNNVAKAIVGLRDKNLIRRVGSRGQVAKWELILPLDPNSTEGQPASPQKRVPASTQKRVGSGHIITVVKPVKNKPKTQSPTLHGASANEPTPQDAEGWSPTPKGKDYFFRYSGLTTEEEFAREVRRFISLNLEKRTSRRALPRMWRNWVEQIQPYQLEKQKKRRNGDSAPPTLADDVKRITKPAERCWQQYDKNLDPTKDPGLFIRRGCNRFAQCDCSTEKRKAILEELDR